ncbi:molybdopterin converting factor subunit 1 [Robiginitalea sp.]|jgi:molybdopterin synthase sulfur carrier subunit|uniref:molybdopterin converting factor subunit 1 n=1 Tax=Robiginitalea sp. TaxID=1902411 RepID=UPI003C73900B
MTVLLFGVTRDIVGTGSLEIPANEAKGLKTVEDLKTHLKKGYPGLKDLSSLAIAVNQSYASEGDPIQDTDEIALIPPVSGG